MSAGTFCHGFVNAQVVEKLHCNVKKKLSNGESVEKIPELNKLWQKVLQSNDSTVVTSSILALIDLVKTSNMKVEDAIDNVVNLASSAKNVKWLVHVGCRLLILQFKFVAKACKKCPYLIWKSPYMVHCHTHPFIFILNSCPRSWNFLLLELQSLFMEYKPLCAELKYWHFGYIMDIFRPFFLHVLLNPSIDSIALSYKSSLLTLLTTNLKLKAINSTKCCAHARNSSIQFLMEVLYHLKLVDFHMQVHHQIFKQINATLCYDQSYVLEVQFVSTLCFSLLSSLNSLKNYPSAGPLASTLYQLLRLATNIEPVSVLSICLSNLICTSSPSALEYLLLCIPEVLKFSNWKCYSKLLALSNILALKASILQLVLHKQCLAFRQLSSFLDNALNEIEKACYFVSPENSPLVPSHNNVEFHDSWLSDACMLSENLLSVEKNCLLVAVRYLLLVKSSENMALNVGLMICGVVISDTFTKELSSLEHNHCISILINIVASFPQLTLTILPTFLYAVQNEENAVKQKYLCLALPNLVSDSNSMPFVLGAIQAMSRVSGLCSFAVGLMLNLWKKQERCFPYLQKVISQTMVLSSKVKTEVVTITSIALRDLCNSQSTQFTSEPLAMISSMLKKKIHPAQAAILLDGVYQLLQKEVVNLPSMWAELLETLLAYNCDTVTKAVLKILSLVPKFVIDTPALNDFQSTVLTWIWSHLQTSSAVAKGAALVCLAHFKIEDFILKYLPLSVRPQLPEDMPEEEFLLQRIPGHILVQIMTTVSSPAQVQYFCGCLISQELQNMPRDIKDRAFQAKKQAVHGNLFSDFSSFVLHMQERNKQPNLKGHFATSALMCYNPSLDDSPKNLVCAGRSALQLLQVLLCEVTVDAKNWKGLLWMVHGWKHFVQLCLQIMIKGRIAELNLQLKQKDCDKDDIQHRLDTAEFWCRDKITDLLKESSKGPPTMQGNSLVALSGLICALKFIMTQEANTDTKTDADSSGYLSHSHWIRMAADTIITAADTKYKSGGRIFSWCQYKAVSRSGRLTTSKFGEVCALQALKMFITALLPHDTDRVLSVLNMLVQRVRNIYEKDSNQNENASSMTILHLNLVLGSISADLVNGKIHESSNQALRERINQSLSTLINNACNCLSSSGENNSDDDDYSSDDDTDDMIGSLLGAGMVLPALFSCGKSMLKEDAIRIFNSMLKYIDNLEEKSGRFLEAFYFAFVAACLAGKTNKCISSDTVVGVLIKLQKELLDNKSIPLAVAVSHLCYDLKACGEQKAQTMFSELFQRFFKDASNEKLPTRQKLTSINGLVALTGSESIFSGCTAEMSQETASNLRSVTKLLKQYTQHGKDVGITSNSIVLLGRLYLALHTSNTRQTSSMPTSFSYLPETSVLRPVFDTVINFIIADASSFQLVKPFVMSLADAVAISTKSLPPVDLLSPLSKFLQLELNENEESACVQLALSQLSENETARMFLDLCIEPSKFQSFCEPSQCLLLKSLHLLTQHIASGNVLSFISSVQTTFFCENRSVFQHAFLQGVLSSLKLSNLPQDIPAFLFEFIAKVIKEYDFSLSDKQLIGHWRITAEAAAEDPNKKILSQSISDDAFLVRILFMKCHLISQGFQPIQWLNENLEQCACSQNVETQKECLWIVFLLLQKRVSATKSSVLLIWLQEIMSVLKKFHADDTIALFWLKILAVSVMTLANRNSLKNLNKGEELLKFEYGKDSLRQISFVWDICLSLLPQMVTILLSQPNITELFSQKMIELLFYLYTNTFKDNPTLRNCLLQAFHSSSKVFQSSSIWTKVASLMFL